ncbi:JmjC domain-containing protein [Rhizobacter sp. LjRoot28]|uniref:JmjC domain-containing protein n=1 Tax=Rhizobacter sp. LjRoot28 TaxID=3342309 RepID=UPI003ED10ADC
MDIHQPTPLLGSISPEEFMKRHWQRKPLLIRQAVPGAVGLPSRSELFALAGEEGVESRLIVHDDAGWTLRHGPIPRRAFPKIEQPRWTVLVQGVDLHVDAAHALISQFRFVPDARLDDLMISWASDGGGVGPHVDAYDVFLLQVQGRRRWRIGRMRDTTLVPDVPLRLLQNFEPEEEFLLEPGDMLYLPPNWAHDGVAEGECMTASIGFRAPPRETLGREVLQRVLDAAEEPDGDVIYQDRGQMPSREPGRIPDSLSKFAADAVARLLKDPKVLACALGELLSEPKPNVCFEPADVLPVGSGVRLDRRTRMLYDDHHVFINGESFKAGGRDAKLMHRLADDRALSAERVQQLSDDALDLLDEWVEAGWAHPAGESARPTPEA